MARRTLIAFQAVRVASPPGDDQASPRSRPHDLALDRGDAHLIFFNHSDT
jgi:hypothetical protein